MGGSQCLPYLDGAERVVVLQGEAGGGYDEVGVDVLPVLHLDPLLRQAVDLSRVHGGLPAPGQ